MEQGDGDRDRGGREGETARRGGEGEGEVTCEVGRERQKLSIVLVDQCEHRVLQ
jgi:hypothetical protein